VSKFIIELRFRLQEWVAEEKGYFRLEGLQYEFRELIRSTDGAHHKTICKSGAFQSIEKARESNVTCACHWTVNVGASKRRSLIKGYFWRCAGRGIGLPTSGRRIAADRRVTDCALGPSE
jgi:hypothetical protein